MPTTSRHICPLCEATCGLQITVDGDQVAGVRGDADDVFSRGFVCPKGVALGDLHHDPARLRAPLVREQGRLREASWEEAFDRIRHGLREVISAGGPEAVGLYLGNPNAHNATSTFYIPALVRALRTPNRFSASTVDQMPQQIALGLMYGTALSVPVPDIDRTDLLVILGGNPLVSNGSMMTVPDMPGRLRALRARGGRLVVIDPVRTRTADAADQHIPIRPGTDVLLLAALVHDVLATSRASLGAAEPWVEPGALDQLQALLAPFPPAAVAELTGVPKATIRDLADQIAHAPSAAVYGRLGTSTSALTADGRPTSFATLASWLVAVLNVVTGNLDRPGGVMFPLPPAGGPTTSGTPGTGLGVRVPGSRRTRVGNLPSILGEFPAAAMAEEIEDGGIRSLICVAGNPVVSLPDAGRVQRALTGLDLFVCLDMYVTETSRHADVVLPAPSPLSRDHYDVVFGSLAVRNSARWSPAVFGLEPGEKDEGEVLLTLAAIAAAVVNDVVEPSAEQMDDLVAAEVARDVSLLSAVAPRRGVARLVDISLRKGPYELTLDDLEASPQGVDLGALQPRLPDVLRTPSGRIELIPAQLAQECRRLAATAPERPGLVLVGRRQLRTNNSWLRTLPRLAGGSSRCTAQVHPADAAAAGVRDGQRVVLASDTGSIDVIVEVTDAVMPGVVCVPHGWADPSGAWADVGSAGSNVNVLTPTTGLDPLSMTAVLNAIPVRLSP